MHKKVHVAWITDYCSEHHNDFRGTDTSKQATHMNTKTTAQMS